jgi:serine/threonine protein kinase
MSPEQVLGRPVDGRADLFSLGLILYEASTGKRPFEGDDLVPLFKAILDDSPLDPRKVDSSIPHALSQLIMRSISKSPEKRFQTGNEMADALKTCLKAIEPEATPKPWAKRRSGLLVTLAFLLFLAFFGGGAWFYHRYYYSLALLQLESSPMGAEVFMDGLPKGKTPLKLRLPLGQYEVRISMKDHYDWEAQLELDKKDKAPVFIKLVPVEKNQP